MELTLEQANSMKDADGNLNLSEHTSLTSLPEGFATGGWVDLRGCTSLISLPEGFTVGGWVDLSGCTSLTSLPEGFTVGDSVFLDSTNIKNPYHVRRLNNGDYVPGKYLYADGILTHVKKKKKVGNYTYFVGKITGKNVVYDGEHYAHCSSLRDGISDLLFKSANDRGAGQYKNLPLDTEMTLEEMVTMYRVITSACRQGSQDFVDSLGDQRRERYTIREAIELTSGQYGAERFSKFFVR